MIIKTLILVVAVGVLSLPSAYADSGSLKVKSDSLAARKNPYPTKGYRAFMEYGAGLFSKDGEKCFYQEWTTIHGCQINSKWFAGVGAELFNPYGAAGAAAFVDGRYELIQKKISPFFDLRVGYTWGDFSGVYVSPSVGYRFSRFNLSLAYEFQSNSNKPEYSECDFSKGSGAMLRFGWDFGARWKDKSLKYKRPLLGTGYRSFLYVSLGTNDEVLVWQFATIHGGQIIPQLFVGGGVISEFYAVFYSRYNQRESSIDDAAWSCIPVISARYDVLPKSVSPFIEARVGYRCQPSSGAIKDDPFYLSPLVGVRLAKFNVAVSYESRNTKLLMQGYYHDYKMKKHFAYPMFHLGFDFGSRVKQEKF